MNQRAAIDDYESNVRSYCRRFPAVFRTAEGSRIYDESGRDYIDFFAGAGALNYGHNNAHLKQALISYVEANGITHSLDFYTSAKEEFITRFVRTILRPRGLDYKLQFTGPTGTNAVEAALKLARKYTNRHDVVAFSNAFHGVTLGALTMTASATKRAAASVPLHYVTRMPFEGFLGNDIDSADFIDGMYKTAGAGLESPAAFIVELVQGEGGLNVASQAWLQRISALAKDLGALLIIDDIQTGCGRVGTFFSFEEMQITPDIVVLSKSLGGMGLPMALVLIRPELDVWEPGEHNGTFRGNNLAFVTGAAALGYWSGDHDFGDPLIDKSALLHEELEQTVRLFARGDAELRGRGLLRGLAFTQAGMAERISRAAFREGLIAETSGPRDEVLKIMPPLTIDRATLGEGFSRLRHATRSVERSCDFHLKRA